MSRKSDLDNVLTKRILSLSTREEKIYANMKISDKNIKSDFASECISVMTEISSDVMSASVEELEQKLIRLKELKKYISQAKIGKREQATLLSNVDKITSAIKKDLSGKNNKLKKAAGALGGIISRIDAEGAMSSFFGDDEAGKILTMVGKGVLGAGKAAGKFATKKVKDAIDKKKENNSALKRDASALVNKAKAAPKAGPKRLPGAGPETTGTGGESAGEGPKEEGFEKSSAILSQMSETLNNILLAVNTTKQDMEIENQQRRTFSNSALLEIQGIHEEIKKENERRRLDESTQRRKLKQSNRTNITESAGGEKGGGLLGGIMGLFGAARGLAGAVLGGGVGGIISTIATTALRGLFKVVTSGAFALVAGLGWAIVDGIAGFAKAPEWGVSNIAGAIGGFFGGTGDSAVKRVIGNMGKWALIGAGIGSFVPVIGTAIGGLIGALIGGLLGWIGGKNIAKAVDSISSWVSKTFKKGVDTVKNFFITIFDTAKNLIDKFLNVVDTIKLSVISWIKSALSWIPKEALEYIPGVGALSQNLDKEEELIKNNMSARQARIEGRQNKTNEEASREATSNEIEKVPERRRHGRDANTERKIRRAEKRNAIRESRQNGELSAGGDLVREPISGKNSSINLRGVLDTIAGAESGSNGYNAMNQGGNDKTGVIGSGNSKDIIGKNLTDLTVGEVLDRGKISLRQAINDPNSGRIFAAGRYQIIPSTLEGLVKQGIVSKSDKFDEETQDRLGVALLEGMNVPKLIDEGRFAEAQNKIAGVWAGIGSSESGQTLLGGPNKSSKSASGKMKVALASAKQPLDVSVAQSKQGLNAVNSGAQIFSVGVNYTPVVQVQAGAGANSTPREAPSSKQIICGTNPIGGSCL